MYNITAPVDFMNPTDFYIYGSIILFIILVIYFLFLKPMLEKQ